MRLSPLRVVARWKTLSLLELWLTPICGSQRVSVSAGLREGLPKVLADRVQLQQVFPNLIMNAMGPVADRACLLRIRSEIHDACRILVTVEDSGIGIDTKDLDRIFDTFLTTKSTGMGMRLSICRSI